ncbi:MAG: AAA family ATPase [Clostridiales bacterium]|nr:AAA family ATPase [Clostridiales bacterium]
MLKRKITDKLLEWKTESNKPCLLIKGARQVGKTFIIDSFAKENYENYLYVNFEFYPEYRSIFDGNLDFKTLRFKLEATFPNVNFVPEKTVLFLDEIQACPNARVALKAFALNGAFDVIASGSLLGLSYKDISSYPVGYERVIELAPLDFEEFLWGAGFKADLIAIAREAFVQKKELNQYLIDRFAEQFKYYTLVGGMPKIVDTFFTSNSLSKVLQMQRALIENYMTDIAKYAKQSDKPKINKCFLSIPSQLAKKNKKFAYTDIDGGKPNNGARQYENSLDWLRDAGIVHYCYNLNEPAIPLISNIKLDCFKVYMRDTGLLIAMLESGVQRAIMEQDFYINEGGIVENICAAEIAARYERIMYFDRKSRLEIDFVLNIDGLAAAIEVKSGGNTKAKSLDSIIENYKTVKRYIKFEKNCNIYVDEKNIEHYPLFMIMFL